MLQRLNERIQGVLAWIVITVIALTFTLFGIDYYMQSRSSSTDVAEVNGEGISKSMFERVYQRLRQQAMGSSFKADQASTLKKQAIDSLTLQMVALQSAKSLGFHVTDLQANATILGIPQFQKDAHFSPQLYQQALSAMMFSSEAFQQEVKQSLLLSQQQFAFLGTEFVLNSEIHRYVQLLNETRDYDYLIVPMTLFQQPSFSEPVLREYYSKHKDEFKTPAQVSITYVLLSSDEVKSTIQVNEEALQQRYAETDQKKPFEQVKESLRSQLLNEQAQSQFSKALEQMTELSYQNPDDLTAVANALHLPIQHTGPFSREGGQDALTKIPALLDAAFSRDVLLLKNNSEPLQLDNGRVLVLRIDKEFPAAYQPFEQVKANIQQRLSLQVAQEATKRAGQEIISGKMPAALKTLAWKSITAATRDVGGEQPGLRALAFDIAHVHQLAGKTLPNGDYAVVRLQTIHPGQWNEKDQSKKASIVRSLEMAYGSVAYDLYQKSLFEQAKIKLN